MAQFITASINLDKINNDKIIPGKKGRYVNISINVKDQPDQFGHDVSIEQRTEKGETRIYLGEGKVYKPKQ